MKTMRHAAILEIIKQNNIETQEDLTLALKGHGIDVTQATVSRDIKELRLIKAQTGDGAYHYAMVDKAERGMTDRFMRIFSDSVLSITSSGNLIVIKTIAGSAHAAAEAVDELSWPEVIGTIAGDNTILVIAQQSASTADIIQRFNALMK